MKQWILIGLTILTGCGGSLSDEQRKKLHEGMEKQKIIKLSDSEIMSASLDQAVAGQPSAVPVRGGSRGQASRRSVHQKLKLAVAPKVRGMPAIFA